MFGPALSLVTIGTFAAGMQTASQHCSRFSGSGNLPRTGTISRDERRKRTKARKSAKQAKKRNRK